MAHRLVKELGIEQEPSIFEKNKVIMLEPSILM